MEEKRLYQHPAMRLLRRAVMRELIVQFLLYFLLLLAGALLAWHFFDASTLIVLFGFFFSFLGGFYLIRLFRHWPVDRHPVLETLCKNPGRIVWVYTVVTQRMPYGLALNEYGLVYLKLIDGRDLCVGLPARHLRVISHCLRRLLPHATFGYSPGKEQLYRINPEMLIQ